MSSRRGTASIILALLFVSVHSLAQDIPKVGLKALNLDFAPLVSVQERPGKALLLELRALPGDGFSLRLPFRPNRFTPAVADGASVMAGAVLGRLSGPELTAWKIHARAIEQQFAAAERRFNDNKPLYDRNALSTSKWLEISNAYYELQSSAHHVEHTLELLRLVGVDSADVIAARAGLVTFSAPGAGDMDEVELVTLYAPDTLRAVGRLPADVKQLPTSLLAADCRLAVSHVEARVEKFSRLIWSEALPACIAAGPGAMLEAELRYAFRGYQVPRAALVTLKGQPGIFLDGDEVLRFAPVDIVSASQGHFYLSSSVELAGGDVLVSSVSAVQGILLGLGAD